MFVFIRYNTPELMAEKLRKKICKLSENLLFLIHCCVYLLIRS